MALELFHPVVREWFAERYGEPTEIQRLAWPPILAGEHVLVAAPTGSGKTLTGFLGALDRLLSGTWSGGATRVLYVSPLKALNADIERNLRAPLAELVAAFGASGLDPAVPRIGVRSGDTPPAERQRMLRRPPEILITTPESLNLLLLSRHAGRIFSGLRLVLLDEIHAAAASKRGTHWITAVDRLVRIAGEFQRVAISATARPLERVARFAAGWRLERGAGGAARFEPRPITIVESRAEKRYELSVRNALPAGEEAADPRTSEDVWRAVAAELAARIAEVRSTIVFTNSRRMAERVTRFVNEAAGRELAWSHHGSLARELRTAIEARLKEGRLPAIVATSSLELGIDVGALERVILLGTPRSLVSAAQRIGRAGHRAGAVSRAIFVPTHGRDFLDAAVAARAVLDGEIEPLVPIRAPLDLLAQVLLAAVAGETWKLDDLYDFVRTSDPYRELSRRQFDLVVEMLAGRYADARIEELKPRVRLDRVDGTIAGRPGLARLLARAGGTIPDRGYFALKTEDGAAKLGELDEEFVWERSVGDVFTLGAQAWRVRAIGANEVFVAPARGGAPMAPFWRADAQDRRSFYSDRVGELLAFADAHLGEPELEDDLIARRGFEPAAAAELVRILSEQRAAQGVPLPHRRHLVIEEAGERAGDPQGDGRRQVLLYTFWGGTVNRPLAMALAALWQEREGDRIETLSDDDAVLLVLPGPDALGAARELLAALDPERIEELLRRRLEGSGFFGAHFRQNAQRALLLPRDSPRRRTPLWVSRQNAKKLLEAVGERDDFPLVLETWRTCLQDELELDVLRDRLRELERGEIAVSAVRVATPSPFASNLVWRRTNEQMYEDDVPAAARASALRGDLLREVALDAAGRPAIPRALAERYRRTAQRLLPGYPPREAGELLEWVKERFWLPLEEWRELLAAIDAERRGADSLPTSAELVESIAAKLVEIPVASGELVVAAAESAILARAAPPLAAAFARARPFRGIEALERGLVKDKDKDLLLKGVASGAGGGGRGGGVVADDGERDEGAVGLAAVLGPWLRFYGPLSVARVREVFGLDDAELSAALAVLERGERAVRGAELVAGGDGDEVVSVAALETLLRWRRAAARPELEPLPLARLPFFVGWQQGLVDRGAGIEGLQAALEKLFGFVAPAGAWEREILPARLDPYLPSWLDALLLESDLRWLGAGRERVTFAFPGDFDLLAVEGSAVAAEGVAEGGSALAPLDAAVLEELARSPRGRDLGELAERLDASTGAVSESLWRLAWAGRAAGDSMRTLRQGVLSGFAPVDAAPLAGAAGGRGSRRAAFRRWSASRSFSGRWFAAAPASAPAGGGADPLDREERNRERVRLLAGRWGILCRELLALEGPAFSWARLGRTIRALELGGELVAGRFVDGLPGLQFAPPATVRALAAGLPDGGLWWHGATDPASLCGIDVPALKAGLPRRQAGNFVVWNGARRLAVIRRGGRDLDIEVAAGAPEVAALLEPLRVALARGFAPERSIAVETIAGEPAAESPYRSAFAGFSVTRDARGLRLRRSYTEPAKPARSAP